MPYESDWAKPAKLVKSMGMPFWGNLKPVIGDKGSHANGIEASCGIGLRMLPWALIALMGGVVGD